jgi:hypothetical protein
LYEFKLKLSTLFLSSVLTLVIHAGFLAGLDDEIIVLGLSDDGVAKINPLSSNNYGLAGISVQQNVTQQNICSSNTAYCYNEVDNDFNVNPP